MWFWTMIDKPKAESVFAQSLGKRVQIVWQAVQV